MKKNETLADHEPLIPATMRLPELTIKVIVLAIILAAVLASANAYLALKIGATISASIPASILALGILRFFKRSNILETNIIQTSASAGEGIAAAISFVLPALVVLGIWKNFHYWETVVITILGGFLGVLFSIPLRRLMLSMPTLRFPEGTAIGNVLRTSAKGGQSLKLLVYGGSVGGLLGLFQTGFNIIADVLHLWFLAGKTLVGISLGFTPATIAAGFIIGYEVSLSLFIGVVLGWIVLIPLLGFFYGLPHEPSAYAMAMDLWDKHLRFAGVGTMLVGGVWTLLTLIKPLAQSIKVSLKNIATGFSGSAKLPRTEQDIPIIWVAGGSFVIAILLFILIFYITKEIGMFYHNDFLVGVVFLSVIYVLFVGFLLASVCAYFTGLVGSSNNPLSGLLIISILLLGFIYLLVFNVHIHTDAFKIIGLVIVITAIISSVAAISNENIQDLKAGQMIGATPWKQQVILLVGVAVSAFLIGPILELLFNAYGIGGAFPRAGMDRSQMLAAPQANLIATVTKGVLVGHLDWPMIGLGGGIAVVCIIIDSFLKKKNRRLPSLAVGLGLYLPSSVTISMVFGGFVNYLVKRKMQKTAKDNSYLTSKGFQSGVLLSCGLVAGAALMGVILAIPFVLMGSSNALTLVPAGYKPIAEVLGVIATLALCYWIYRVCMRNNLKE